MFVNHDEPLWVEKYRPRTVADTILPSAVKKTLQSFVDKDFIPNVTFSGPPGIGKTTAALAIIAELKAECYFINSSIKGNIDTLRNDLAEYASSVSFSGKRKYILLDEADYLNPNSTQPALRGFIEQYSRNCGVILTCNYPTRLMEPILSRCPVVDFTIPADEKMAIAAEIYNRIVDILNAEGESLDEGDVAWLIERNYPDWRKIINLLQNSSQKGSTLVNTLADEDIKRLFRLLKEQNFTQVREWCAHYGTDHPRELFRSMYNMSVDYLTPMGQAQLVLSINKYEYNAAFVANQEINLVAAMVEIMSEAEFK